MVGGCGDLQWNDNLQWNGDDVVVAAISVAICMVEGEKKNGKEEEKGNVGMRNGCGEEEKGNVGMLKRANESESNK